MTTDNTDPFTSNQTKILEIAAKFGDGHPTGLGPTIDAALAARTEESRRRLEEIARDLGDAAETAREYKDSLSSTD
ncbi:Uncharacterised protein [Mycobacteroides abscessus subsp. abscessus]|uniref:Uncharacterized protein n=1 Tax=Mycobacteroides abscessus TaxID=36809 RepID=A0AB33T9F7_9MYCO|nr:hypothetical protein [Mycobacteroides abscessus]EIC69381.1 hypothetical protein S7W_10629 [Mycobacteroides abscessus M94]MDO3014819.1 hypothetical protein [Mycobacteroides abscessus subsp. abscessus]MDO3086264.1 hypothetical protein [Mycobacteroides abscessus subsp. abscessus]MDO3170167.1 hypothetical protein [Mycobacteroides abscessus subsp. abscessus]OLT79228.1 hypothetical protein BKG58_20305 [Mycobacteroides abscessus subsp. abscessus]